MKIYRLTGSRRSGKTRIFRSYVFGCIALVFILCSGWGFFAHKKINRTAIFTLPPDMIRFYKRNLDYLSEHAVDPDKRRYADPLEGSKHFLDADYFGKNPFDSIPQKWKDAVEKYSEDTLRKHGTIPWQIQFTYFSLVKAFEERNTKKILKHSADLGHYIADAHVPLHTTRNYNGQLTNQHGIHGFWESRLPELFTENYTLFAGRATYVENPLERAWQIVKETYSNKDSVFLIEARLSRSFPSDQKFSFIERNGILIKAYSEAYSNAYHIALKGMVEKQMRASIREVGNFWFSAWVDAGQPDLEKLEQAIASKEELAESETQEKLFKKGKIFGRSDSD